MKNSRFQIVICKLRSENTASESHTRQHWGAAKALLVIFPLLGISYIITLVVPPQGATGHRVFQYVRALLLSLQVLLHNLFSLKKTDYYRYVCRAL